MTFYKVIYNEMKHTCFCGRLQTRFASVISVRRADGDRLCVDCFLAGVILAGSRLGVFVLRLFRDHPEGRGPLAVGRQNFGHVRDGGLLFAVFNLEVLIRPDYNCRMR